MQQPTTVRPLRAGVIGLGWAGEQHLKGYLNAPGVQVMALAGLEEERGQQLLSTYNVPVLYSSYEELLQRDDIDMVSVAVPNFLHAPVGIAALEAGKHVLCEKPMALNGPDARAMVDAAEKAERVLQVAFNYRRRGDAIVLKRHIDEGHLGRIYYAKAHWMRRSGIPGLGSWFTSKQLAGGGPLIDLGVHVLDLTLWMLGEPQVRSVSAATYAELGPRGRGGFPGATKSGSGNAYEVEDLATAFIRLEGGVVLQLEVSWAGYSSAGDDFGLALFGTEGGAEINVKNYGWEDTLRIFNDVGGVPAVVAPRVLRGEDHSGVVRDFVAAIRNGDDPLAGGLQGLRRSQIIDACYLSAQQGHEVDVIEDARG